MRIFKILIAVLIFSLQTIAQTDNAAFVKSYGFETNKDYEGAIEAIKSLQTYEANMRLGSLYYKIGFNRAASSYYENAIKQMPNSVEARLAVTYPLNVAGNTDQIITQYKKIIEVEPYNLTANYDLGSVYYYKNDFVNAAPCFEKILSAYPFNYDALLMSAW